MSYFFPVASDGRISSRFGPRSSPGGIGSTNHSGIDIAAPYNTPVVAAYGGTVTRADYSKSYGNVVYVAGNDGIEYRYAHLANIGVQPGQAIAGGSTIGGVGSTGISTGNHLHFETRKDGKPFDPSGLLAKAKGLIDSGIGKKALDGARVALAGATGGASEAIIKAGEFVGVVPGCNWFCEFKNWLKDSQFVTRIAVGFLALIFIWAAFTLLASGTVQRSVTQAIKG